MSVWGRCSKPIATIWHCQRNCTATSTWQHHWHEYNRVSAEKMFFDVFGRTLLTSEWEKCTFTFCHKILKFFDKEQESERYKWWWIFPSVPNIINIFSSSSSLPKKFLLEQIKVLKSGNKCPNEIGTDDTVFHQFLFPLERNSVFLFILFSKQGPLYHAAISSHKAQFLCQWYFMPVTWSKKPPTPPTPILWILFVSLWLFNTSFSGKVISLMPVSRNCWVCDTLEKLFA